MTEIEPKAAGSAAPRPFYRRGWFIAAAVIVAVPIMAAAWYLGSPLFLNKTVVEAFPVATTVAVTGDATTATAPNETAQTEGGQTGTDEAVEPPEVVAAQDTAAHRATEDANDPAGDEAAATAVGPVAVLTGSFAGADSRHQGSGTATIYELEDGSRILRLENLDVTNGPDLHVIVTPVAAPESREDVSAAGYIDLGSLKGNRGDQNYEIPADFDLSQAGSIVIYCQPFHVIFATAGLSQA